MINEQEIKQLFSRLQNIQSGTSTGGRAGSKIWFKLPQGQEQAICVKDVEPGACLGLKADDGQWYLTQASEISREERSRHQISYRRCEQKPENNYPIISLLYQDQNLSQAPLKPEFKIAEYWLTGNKKYKLKLITSKDGDPSIGYDDDKMTVANDAANAFVHNYGKGKYLFASFRFDFATGYEFIIKKPTGETVEIKSPSNAGFGYLGNGIYQFYIENGIGRSLDAMLPDIRINNETRMFVRNGTIGDVYYGLDAPGAYLDGFGGNVKYLTSSSGGFGFYATSRLNSYILPEGKNYTIYDGELIELSGSVSINLGGIFEYEGVPTANNNYIPQFLDRPLFGWRNRTVSHTTWLPNENKTFTFFSTASKDTVSDQDNIYKYTYLETMSGELMLMSWEKDYIVHKFSGVNKETKHIVNEETKHIEGNNATLAEYIAPGTQILTLKRYGDVDGDNDLQLNATGKFLILPKTYNTSLTPGTVSFSVRLDYGLDFYTDRLNPSLDLSSYIGEKIITSQTMGGVNYIIRGFIKGFTEDANGRLNFNITVENMSSIPRAESSLNFIKNRNHPFVDFIVLDNGCFWNYYLSSAINAGAISYKRFNYDGFSFKDIEGMSFGTRRKTLTCDQTMGFIHTNPITVPFCALYLDDIYAPPARVLLTDNLVGRSIYRVNDFSLIDSYVDGSTAEELKIKKMPVSEWKIDDEGNVVYSKTFLVDYINKFPHINPDTKTIDPNLTQFGSSYHPKV